MPSDSKSKLSAEERRRKTLEAVANEFAKNGFEGTRMADLADAAEISEAMLVKLYDSKENLYQALIKRKIDQTPGTPFPKDLRNESPETVLGTLADNLRERCEDDPAFLRLLYYSALEDNELSDLFYEARIQKLRNQLSAYIREMIDAGRFRDLPPDEVAFSFMGMICHALSMKHIFEFPNPADRKTDDLIETFVDLFLDGVRS